MRAQNISLGHGDTTIRPMLINTPHSAIESLWFHYAINDIPDAIEHAYGQRPTIKWNRTNTDPWTLSLR